MVYIIISVIVILFYILNQNLLQITKHKVSFKKLPNNFDGYTIINLSDLHNKRFGKDNIRLLQKIDKVNPDAIFITGDMVDRYSKIEKFSITIDLVTNLSKKYKVYYSLGNHEMFFEGEILENYKERIRMAGAIILDDKKIQIEKNNENINVYGLDFKFSMEPHTKQNRGKIIDGLKIINDSIGKVNEKEFNILMSHDALEFKEYSDWGADLTFSGHVHGGIIRIFGKGLLSPRRRFFPKYSYGIYNDNKSMMSVSRGLGDSRIKMRLFNIPEIAVVELNTLN